MRAGQRVEILARARPVRNFGDPGAFDYRGALEQQGINLTATLRNPALMQEMPGAAPKVTHYLARLRGRLLNDLDDMLRPAEDRTAIARAMLLGDRSFLDSQEAESFRETGAFHILVLAGLHVGVLAALFFWAGKKLRLPIAARAMLTIAALGFYLTIIEDRPPIMRAALMATIYLLGGMLYRRMALLNAVSLAAVVILLFRPSELAQASFQLSFLAAAILAGIAAPLLERTAEPYHRALEHLGDVTRDGGYAAEGGGIAPRPARRVRVAAVAVTCKSWGILRRRCGASVPRWIAAVGTGRALHRPADRDASADGAGFQSSLFHRADSEHSCRAADRDHRAAWVCSAGGRRGMERLRTSAGARARFSDRHAGGVDPLVRTASFVFGARSFTANGSAGRIFCCGNRRLGRDSDRAENGRGGRDSAWCLDWQR